LQRTEHSVWGYFLIFIAVVHGIVESSHVNIVVKIKAWMHHYEHEVFGGLFIFPYFVNVFEGALRI